MAYSNLKKCEKSCFLFHDVHIVFHEAGQPASQPKLLIKSKVRDHDRTCRLLTNLEPDIRVRKAEKREAAYDGTVLDGPGEGVVGLDLEGNERGAHELEQGNELAATARREVGQGG